MALNLRSERPFGQGLGVPEALLDIAPGTAEGTLHRPAQIAARGLAIGLGRFELFGQWRRHRTVSASRRL